MPALTCPFCSSTADAGYACGACGRSFVLLGRWRLEALLHRDGAKMRYSARDSQNPYAPAVEAWLSRDPSAVDGDGALAAGHEDGGLFVVVRPPLQTYGASPVWQGQPVPRPPRSGAGCVVAVVAGLAVLGVAGAAAAVFMRARPSAPPGPPGSPGSPQATTNTTCDKPMSLSGKNLVGDTGGVLATTGCDLLLDGVNVDGPLIVRGTAHVRIQGSNVRQVGPLPAIGVYDQAEVTVGGSNVNGEFAADVESQGHLVATGSIFVGRVIRADTATIEGVDENPPRPKAASPTPTASATASAAPDWSKNACAPIFPCYQKAKAFGQVNGKLVVSVSGSGHATAVAVTGAVPPAVQACLRSAGMAETLDGYSGPPGKVTCSWSGTIMEGGEMAMYDSDFSTGK